YQVLAVPVDGSGRQRDNGRFGCFLRLLVVPVDIPEIRIRADVRESNQVQQVERRGRIIGDGSLVDFDGNADVSLGRHLAGSAHSLGGANEVLFGRGPAGALRDLLALPTGARSARMR